MCDVLNAFGELGKYANYIAIPPILILFILGCLILFSDFKKTTNRIYFLLSIFLIIWITSDFLSYKFSDPNNILWADRTSALGLFAGVLFVLFIYIFPEKEKISGKLLIYLVAPLVPFFMLVPTKFYEIIGPAPKCETFTSSAYWIMLAISVYYILLGIIISIQKIKKLNENQKKQFKIFAGGSLGVIFLAIIIDILPSIFNIEYIILFVPYTILIFAGFCAYSIVKYKSLNAKIIAAQALVFFLVILIGSELFFAESVTNEILILITLALSLGFGYFLIKSVKAEVKRKEELQYMSDQLAKANDQLKKLDNAKSDFISIASHQLRTPLTSIKGFISLLTEGSYGKVTALQQETLNKVYQSNERLIHLVEDLLNISRIESGRMEFDFAPCQVADLCQEVVDGFIIRAKNSKLYLEYKNPAVPLPEIMIDLGKVREVISNMVDNALKYTPKGGVTVKLEQREANLRVTISDTGIGIPVTELPYLFSKFSRGKDTGRLNATGTGLGLYVGKSMIEANGGKIWAESDGEGKGSRFIIELPVKQSEEVLAQWGK